MKNMFNIRHKALGRQQPQDMIEISGQGEDVPLQQNWSNRWCSLSVDFKSKSDEIYNFEVYEDDVFVVTFPKSGTHWLREAGWLLLNDLNYEKAKEAHLNVRSIFLDLSAMVSDVSRNSIELAANLPRPRLIITHLPAHLMPRQVWQKKVKIIYCARNPKDVVCSYYPFIRDFGRWQGTMDEFIDDFISYDIWYMPYWPHVLDFWHMRDNPQIFFTTFEAMKKNLKAVIKDLNQFLDKPPLSDKDLSILLEYLNFDNMKANKKTNPTESIKNLDGRVSKGLQFMRRGIVGAYRDELSEEKQKQLNEWSKKCLAGEDLTEEDIFGNI